LKEGWPQHNDSQGIEYLLAAGVVDCLFKLRHFPFEGFSYLIFYKFRFLKYYQSVNFPLLLKEGWPQHHYSQALQKLVAAGVVDWSIRSWPQHNDNQGIEEACCGRGG
jgi:hypothetical protein